MAHKPKFIPDRMNLPLFFLGRKNLNRDRPEFLCSYLEKQAKFYGRGCVEENKTVTATREKSLHLIGFREKEEQKCEEPKLLNIKRDLIVEKPWILPPNRYEVGKEPFAKRKGQIGAYWSQTARSKPKTMLPANQFQDPGRFYEKKSGIEEILYDECNAFKGYFRPDLREKRGATRLHVTRLTDCYKRPDDPNATKYFPKQHTIEQNIAPEQRRHRPNPHLFYARSHVPYSRHNTIHEKDSSFKVGPGRYENRYREVCHCSAHLEYYPDIWQEILRQQRLKFRDLPFKKINPSEYCIPDWRHVKGKGHTHLFKNIPQPPPSPKPRKSQMLSRPSLKPQAKKTIMEPRYADSEYLNMIKNPERTPISFRNYKLKRPTPSMGFSSTTRGTVRKQLKFSRKIAFSSGQERFKDLPNLIPIRRKDRLALIALLPPERRLHNFPIMTKPASQITSKLFDVPAHMKPLYKPKLRKRIFKFAVMSGVKFLFTPEYAIGELADENFEVEPYFAKPPPLSYFLKAPEDIDPKYRALALTL